MPTLMGAVWIAPLRSDFITARKACAYCRDGTLGKASASSEQWPLESPRMGDERRWVRGRKTPCIWREACLIQGLSLKYSAHLFEYLVSDFVKHMFSDRTNARHKQGTAYIWVQPTGSKMVLPDHGDEKAALPICVRSRYIYCKLGA